MSIFSEKIYDGISSYGQIMTTIKLIGSIIALIIAIIIIIIIIFMLKNDKLTSSVVGIVTKSDCIFQQSNDPKKNISNYSCNITVEYTVNNIKYEKNHMFQSNTPVNVNAPMEIDYEPSNPKNSRLHLPKTIIYIIGGICYCIFFIVFIGALISYYFANKNKVYSSVIGTSSLIGNITNALK
jgi:ATP-dependent Zn protease